MGPKRGFSLIELLVVIAVIAILAAMLFPVLSSAKARAQRTICIYNLHQINFGIHMYLDDNNGSPGNTNMMHLPFVNWTGYRQLINNDVGIQGASSAHDRLFACPADSFFYDMSRNGQGYVPQPLHEQTNQAFTSYAFNAGQFSTSQRTTNNPATTNYYGIAGQRLETIRHPTKTVLVAEVPAFLPYSWHQPKLPFSKVNAVFTDAKDVICFVDGHVNYVKIYFNGSKIAWDYNPPAGYDYQWSGD